jgi:hypothetical protein
MIMTVTNVKFQLHINTGNAAVADEPFIAVAEQLEAAAARLRDYFADGTMRDANGQPIGNWYLSTLSE